MVAFSECKSYGADWRAAQAAHRCKRGEVPLQVAAPLDEKLLVDALEDRLACFIRGAASYVGRRHTWVGDMRWLASFALQGRLARQLGQRVVRVLFLELLVESNH